MADQGTVVQFKKDEPESMEEATDEEHGLFSVLASALDEADEGEETRVRLEPALVNGKRRVVVWVDDDEEDDGMTSPVAILVTDADTIQAESAEYVESGEQHTVH